jgi:HpiC1 cyclase
MLRNIIRLSAVVIVILWAESPLWSGSIPIENASFEAPAVDPNAFPALPMVDGWMEIDVDTVASANTGVFANTPAESPDHVVNADGRQLAFLGSEQGNALEQDLVATYEVGCDYRLTVAVGVSAMFPPSAEAPSDALELVLYYRDANEPVDIVWQAVAATGQSATQLQDFSAYLPAVQADDAWAGQTIGVAIRAVGVPGGFWDLDNVRLMELQPVSVAVENASFEAPAVDPNAFPAVPIVDGWTEFDLDSMASSNTGVFANTATGSPDHVGNADGRQLAFLGSEQGNALEQDVTAIYRVGCEYRLTVAVGVSALFPPSAEMPADALELVLYYRDANEPVDIVWQAVPALGQSATQLQNFSVHLPSVQVDAAWADQGIGIAIRAVGAAGGFWDLDNVRLVELMPESTPIENASFEGPPVDPKAFPALPMVDAWTELDLDTAGSANTGVFANTAADSPDHVVNADGTQLAFLGSEYGNALEQDLAETYAVGCAYRLTVGVGVSARFPPVADVPADSLELILYYRNGDEIVDLVTQVVGATGQMATHLQDFSAYLPTVQPSDAWAGQTIGVAIRASGAPGGFWDLDHVRLAKSPLAEAAEPMVEE